MPLKKQAESTTQEEGGEEMVVDTKKRGRGRPKRTDAPVKKAEKKPVHSEDEENENEESEEEKPEVKKRVGRNAKAAPAPINYDEGSDEEKPKPAGKKRGRKAKAPAPKESEDEELGSEEEKEAKPKPEPKKRGRKPAAKVEVEEDDDMNGAEEKPKAEPKKRGRRPKEPVEEKEKEDNDVEAEEPKSKQQKKRGGRKPAAAAKVEEVEEDNEEEEADDASEEEEKPKPELKTYARKNNKKAESDDTEEEKPETNGKEEANVIAKKATVNNTITAYDTLNFTSDKKNALGELPNLKIASWNVAGLRSWITKDGLTYIKAEDADIVCLQETKCQEGKIPQPMLDAIDTCSYHRYWLDSLKAGHGGVALLSRVKPVRVTYGLHDGEDNTDSTSLVEGDDGGRLITAEYDGYYVICVYVPNAGRALVNLEKRLVWNKAFHAYLRRLDALKPIILCGDMNVAHSEIDLSNPKSNHKNAGFSPQEREGMTNLLEDGFVDTFRALYKDVPDKYTFWTYMSNARSRNVGWRLDYFIVSSRLLENICDNEMRTKVFGSDHCPITLTLNK